MTDWIKEIKGMLNNDRTLLQALEYSKQVDEIMNQAVNKMAQPEDAFFVLVSSADTFLTNF